MSISLRDWLLSSLRTLALPSTREMHLHVLVSTPRKHTELYPFAIPRPKTYLQDILVLLSERPIEEDDEKGGDGAKERRAKRMLSVGIEAYVYYVPSTTSGVLYISKVDTTGHGSRPSAARTLVKSLVLYYCGGEGVVMGREVRQMWVHVFARAQGQYLFPNSSEWEGKKPLSDVRLCAWWRRVFGEAGREIGAGEGRRVGMWYVLPGYGEVEGGRALDLAGGGDGGMGWRYGHPYVQEEIGLPCPRPPGYGVIEGRKMNLGHFIPSFEDDPKARFMDEMAYTTETEGVPPPSPKRARKTEGGGGESGSSVSGAGRGGKALGELGDVNADEFWERMWFRQECVAGAMTGFFTVGIGWERTTTTTEGGGVSETGMEGEVSEKVMKRVMKMMLNGVEFSNVERAEWGTDTVEGAIRGLCEGLKGGYEGKVYGSIVVKGVKGIRESDKRETEKVIRVLTARKRRKVS